MSKEDEQIEDDNEHRAEDQYQNFFFNSRAGFYRSTPQGTYLEVNPALVDMLGYKSREELMKASIPGEIYAHQEERPGPDAREDGFTVRLKRKDGSSFWAEISSWVIKDQKGRPKYYEGIVRDVTDRKRYIDELRKTREQLQITLESIGDGVIVTDTEGLIVLMNERAQQLTEYELEEVYQQPLEDVFHIINEFSRKQVSNPVKKVIESGKTAGLANHTVLISKNGRERAIADSAAPIKNDQGEIKGVVLVFRDVTERREMLNELKFEEQKYRTLFENTGTAMGIIRADTTFEMVNNEMVRLTGYDRRELEDKMSWKCLVAKENERERMEEYHRLRREETTSPPPNSYEFTLVNKSGTQKHVLVRVSMIPETTKSIVSLLDITRRKNYEDRITYLGYHDEMTGLYNRNYFKEAMERLDTERQLPLSIIMGDINGLKLINDGFGHQQGDELIKKTAEIIQSCCRKEDIVSRWGGDEFVILLPRTRNGEAAKIKDRIKQACKQAEEEVPVQPSIALGYATKTSGEQKIDEVLKKAEKWVYKRKLVESESIRSSIISSLEETLLEKDYEAREHAERIKKLALKFGRQLELPENRLNELEMLASLHDIGKIAIDEEILLKETALTDEEGELIKKHPEKGYRIAQTSTELASISEDILYHHEWWDGSGYPRGLKGEEIPAAARIIAIVDAYDVMLQGRPYKDPISKKEAVEELKEWAGVQFDPYLVEVFIEEVLEEECCSGEIFSD